MSKILMVAKGTYGDIFPLYAVAQKLRSRGHAVSFATQTQHRRATESLGFPVVALDESDQRQNQHLPALKWLWKTLSPQTLAYEAGVLLDAAANADLVVGNQIALLASSVAKNRGKPYVYCPVSPLRIPSRHDQILFPWTQRLQRLTMGQSKWQPVFFDIHRITTRLMMPSVARQRRLLDKSDRLHPGLEGMYSSELNLVLSSPLLLDQQPDWPKPTVLTGFSWFEPDFFKDMQKLEKMQAFLDAGKPPVVFALGGTSRLSPGRFFNESVRVCKLLGVRGIIVAAKRFHADIEGVDKDILLTNYVPYSSLFSRVQAVVHSGGIGTISWCLKYQLPSLLVPNDMDQYDNAFRAASRGFAHVVFDRPFRAVHIARALGNLLDDRQISMRLEAAARLVAQEDGATVACDSIEQILAR